MRALQLFVSDGAVATAILANRGAMVSETKNTDDDDRDGSKFAFYTEPDGDGSAIEEV